MDYTNELPLGWGVASLAEILKSLESGKRPKGGARGIEYGIPSIGGEHLTKNGGFIFDKIRYVPSDFASKMTKGIISIGSILVVKDGATSGKTSLVNDDFPFELAVVNEHVFVCNVTDLLNKKYVFYYLWSADGNRQILEDFRGAAQGGISTSFANIVKLSIPPINEQNRIVERLEELFSEIDAGVKALKTAQEQLKVYRQAVLREAFEGKLTAEWRACQINLSSVADLVKLIESEREKAEHISGKKSRDVGELDEDRLRSLSRLPCNWVWIKLGKIVTKVEYGTSEKSKKIGGVPVVRMGNIQRSKISWEDLAYTDNIADIEKYKLEYDDILFNRTNSPELVGKTAIYKGERPSIFAGYLIRLNQVRTIVNGDYLNYYLNSITARKYGNEVKTDGVNQSNINGDKLINYPFPYCSIIEQQQIVQEIETRLSICDNFEETIEQSLAKAEVLRQSILQRAFAGQLVSQDPNDEPACKLLERIRLARENDDGEKTSAKGRTKK